MNECFPETCLNLAGLTLTACLDLPPAVTFGEKTLTGDCFAGPGHLPP
jgi:hypothetical protein